MTIIMELIKSMPIDSDPDNGNADFWESNTYAERIGGSIVELEDGLLIINGRFYDYEDLSLINVDVLIEKIVDSEHGNHFTVTSYLIETDTEYHFDENSDSLSEAFESLETYAPGPSYRDAWNAHDFTRGHAKEYGNALSIDEFPWRSETYPDEIIISPLVIYIHRDYDVEGLPDHYFTIYAGAAGFNSGDISFSTFEELVAAQVNFKK